MFKFQDTISVHNPNFYASRFLTFMTEKVFKKGTGTFLHLFFGFLDVFSFSLSLSLSLTFFSFPIHFLAQI